MEEVLTRMMKVEFEVGRIGQFYHPMGCPIFTHLLYVDDFLVFTNGERCLMKQLLTILGRYEKWLVWAIYQQGKVGYFFLIEDQQHLEKGP